MAVRTQNRKVDVELARIEMRREIGRIVAIGILVVVGIAAFSLPLREMQGLVKPIAGKRTIIEAGVLFKTGIAVSVVVNIGQWIKGRGRQSEIDRLQVRLERYEGPSV